ncbi:hypothetical protein [Salipiger abyssi]|uniref:hypothetical protein n=1 Tax=Salipiger abyssi TaxID=1250539 RepID=UPI001A8DC93F|nr:hypothetical protein [Salipiger abyssi]MBN9889377.1 hypothetical protein [Salipiger abyssi]
MMKFFIFVLFLAIAPLHANAQESAETPPADTRIEVDEDNDVIRFFIDGEEAAYLSKEGFMVRDSVAYGGTIRDHNGKVFESNTAETPQEEVE